MITPERLQRVRPYRSRKKFWTRRERAQFLARLGRYSIASSYVAALLLPGGFALLPVIAWWQRHKRGAEPTKRARRTARQLSPAGKGLIGWGNRSIKIRKKIRTN